MALHDSLRELVSVRGASVVDEAEELRGALDDFLAEDEASLGELNLLVDAVRLGALRRVLDVLAHGAEPSAAVREAGAALARDRGTDDPSRSCWALAALAFALGEVDESLVRMFRSDAGTVPAATPPAAPNGPAPRPVTSGPGGPAGPVGDALGASTVDRPRTQSLTPDSAGPPPPPAPTTEVGAPPPPPPQPYGAGPVPPAVPERRSSRAGTYLLVLLVALIIGGLVAAGVILLQDDDKADDPTASDSPSSRSSGGPRPKAPLVADDDLLVPYVVDGMSTVYQVNVFDGTHEQVTPDGVNARVPTISPDRRTMTYQDFTDVPAGQKSGVTMSIDLATDEVRPLFAEVPACAHSGRPGWSLDGERIAVVCTGDDDRPEGIYVADADGSDASLVYESSQLRGSPTWISDTEFVFASYETQDGPVQLQILDADRRGDPVLVPSPDEGQISHADWSPATQKLLFLVSPPGSEEERGDVWTTNLTGTDKHVLAAGGYAHPVWNVDGSKIGVTLIDDTGAEVLGYIDVSDPDGSDNQAEVVPDPPPGKVAIPVWASR